VSRFLAVFVGLITSRVKVKSQILFDIFCIPSEAVMASHLLAMELVRAVKVSVSLARIFQAHLYSDVRIFVSDPVEHV